MLQFDSPTNFRTIVALSCLTGKPVELTNINSFDESPGIRGTLDLTRQTTR